MKRFALSFALLVSTMRAAPSPYVFMAGNGSTVSVYDAHALNEKNWISYPGLPWSTVFSSDGTKAYVTTGEIFITDASTHRITGALPSHDARLLRLSADGQHLLAANADNTIWVYDLATGGITAKILPHTLSPTEYSTSDLEVSADGSLIVQSMFLSCGEDCGPHQPPALVTEISGTNYGFLRQILPVYATAVAISPDSSSIYVATGTNIQKFGAANGALLNTIAAPANALLMDGAGGLLFAGYAPSVGQGSVSAITISNDQIAGQVNMSNPISSLALTPDNGTLFAAGCVFTANAAYYPCTATAIATANLQVGSSISLMGYPGSLVIAPNGNEIWVNNTTPAQVTVVNSAINKVIGGAEVGYVPYLLAVTPNGSKVYATSAVSGEITAIDGHTLARLAVLNVGQMFNVLGYSAVSPDGARAYIMLDGIQVIDTSTDQIVGKITDEPQAVAVSNDSKTLFTLDFFGSTFSIGAYSTATLQKLYSGKIGSALPYKLLISPVNNQLFVIATNAIEFVNPNPVQVVRTINQDCLDGAVSPDGSLLYCLTPPGQGNLNVLVYNTSTGSLMNTFSTNNSGGSASVAITPDGGSLYISIGSNPPVLEKMNTSTGAISNANTLLSGQVAIQ